MRRAKPLARTWVKGLRYGPDGLDFILWAMGSQWKG